MDKGSRARVEAHQYHRGYRYWRDLGPEQLPDFGYIGRTVAIAEETIVTDAVLALWQHVDQEPADKLGSGQRHGFVPTRTVYTVVLDAECDALVVCANQSAVGYGDPVRVARQVGQRAKAQLNRDQTDQFYTGNLANFAPGLTQRRYCR